MRIGLIGAGGITTPHLNAFVRHPKVTEVAVADPSSEALQRVAAQFGIIKKTYADHRALLEDEDIQIVDICTPHYLHAPQAIEAMQAGKHVILEKPMAVTAQQCDEMIRVSEQTGRRLLCALCMRKFPAHIKAKELMDAGEIGKVFMGTVNIIGNEFGRMNDPDNWKGDWEKAGGGAMFDTGYHAVYVLQHMFGPARAVTATAKRLVVEPENKADDTSVVALEMDDNVLCSVVVTYSATGDRWSEERRFVGPEGSILVRDDPEDEMPLIVFHGAEFQPIRVRNPMGVGRWAIRELVTEFIDCILSGDEHGVSIQEARSAVATVTAIYKSAREGIRVTLGG